MGRYYSYLLPKQGGGASQIQINKTQSTRTGTPCTRKLVTSPIDFYSMSNRHMKKHHQEDASEVPKWSFCGSCGKEITSNYMATHSLRFHDLTPCLDCGDWFKGLSLLECHLEVRCGAGRGRLKGRVSLHDCRDNTIFILQNCEKGAKRDLCDHLLAQTDGRVKLPCPRDKANLIKRYSCVISQIS